MNADIIRKLDMLKRIIRFILDNLVVPAIPRLTAAQAIVVTTITALEAAAEEQELGSGHSEGGVDLRVTTARDLRAYLKDVCRTGRRLETIHPGVAASFRLPTSGSYPALMARARAIITTATPIQASFVAAGLPETFLTELQALLTAFETATAQKHDGGIIQVNGTADLRAKVSLGMSAATDLDACVRNHFRNNPGKIAAWAHARRIELAPRRSASTGVPAVPSSPATTDGQGGGAQSN